MLTYKDLPGGLSTLVLISKVEHTNQYHYKIWADNGDNLDKLADMWAAYVEGDIPRCKWPSDIISQQPIVATSDIVLDSVISGLLQTVNPNLLYTDMRKLEKILSNLILA